MIKREITSLQHELVKHLVRLRQNRAYREEHQSVLISGLKIVSEVCQQQRAKRLITCDESSIPAGMLCDEILVVNEAIMQKISGLAQPEGLLAEVVMPKTDLQVGKSLQYLIACDGINDPGNLGNLLRTALALGWQGVFLLGDCCDPFNDKALRAAKGATFRLPLLSGSWEDLNKLIQENQLQPWVADLEGTPLAQIGEQAGVLLVLSNEAHGVSKEAAQICQKVTIPMPGKMESLNVSSAGAILMYVLKGRLNG